MASKSTKSKNYSDFMKNAKSCAVLRSKGGFDKSSNDANDHFHFCAEYLYGIKSSEIWKTPSLDRTKSTFFILPEAPTGYFAIEEYVSSGAIKPSRGDFAKFWLDELSDLHKDRYLLVVYLAVYKNVSRDISRLVFGPNGPNEISDLWNEKITQASQLVRGFVMEKNKSKFRRGDGLSLLVNAHSIDDLIEIMHSHLGPLYQSIDVRLDSMIQGSHSSLKAALADRLKTVVGTMICCALSNFAYTYFIWVSYDAQTLRRYANVLERKGKSVIEYLDGDSRLNDQIDFMRKLKLAAPRWSQNDRQMILQAIESSGQSCRGTFVQILLNEVGVEKFKKLVFGKQHFCANCRRSSYLSDNRLLACKLCDTDGIRPRAWYCDRDCQKADWRRHRASKHPSMVAVEKASKKKKRKPRKK